jgi:hypothetical protein
VIVFVGMTGGRMSASGNPATYVGEFVDGSGIIPDLNARHGNRMWTYLRDRAAVHTAAPTVQFSVTVLKVLRDCPAGHESNRRCLRHSR